MGRATGNHGGEDERRSGYVTLPWPLAAFVRLAWIGPIVVALVTALLAMQLAKLERDPSTNLFGPDHPIMDAPKTIEARFSGTRAATIIVIAPRDGQAVSAKILGYLKALEPQIYALSLVHADDPARLMEIASANGSVAANVRAIVDGGINVEDRSALIELAARLSGRARTFADELALRVRPVERVRSLVNIEDLRADDDLLVAERLVDAIPQTEEGYAALRARIGANPLFRDSVISRDGKAVAMQVVFRFSNDGQNAPLLVEAQRSLRTILDAQRIGEPTSMGGGPIVLAEVSRALQEDNNRLIPFALLVMVVILGLCFRSIGGVLLTLAACVFTVVWTLGFMTWMGVPMNIITSGMPVILLTIAVADAVHFISRVQIELSRGDAKYAVSEALRILWTPMFLTSLTTVVGFLSLAVTQFEFLRMAGLFTAIGAAFAWVIAVLLLPGLLLAFPRLAGRPRSEAAWERGPLTGFMRLVTANARGSLVVVTVVAGVAVYLASGIRVGFSNVEAFSPDSEMRKELAGVTKHYKSVFPLDLLIRSSRERGLIEPEAMKFMADLEDRLHRNAEIGAVLGPAAFVKRIHQVLVPGADFELPSPLTSAALGQYLLLYESGSGQEIRDYLDTDYRYARVNARADTDNAVKWRTITNDILAFAEANAPAGVTVAGANYGHFAVRIMEDVVSGQIANLFTSMVGVGLVLAVFYRSIIVALIGLAPVALTLAINFAWMSETGVWLDVGTSMIAGITFGVGVDYSIHILSALKGTTGEDWRERVLQSVGLVSRPIVFNTVGVAVGFLVLTLASYQPIQHMGRFAAATLTISAVIALVVIPLLVFASQPRALNRSHARARLREEVTAS